MYIRTVVSNLLSKIFDNIMIERKSLVISTSNYQFGFKFRSSTVWYLFTIERCIAIVCVHGDVNRNVLLIIK